MENGPVRKLLQQEEYWHLDFETVLVEGQFVELDDKGEALVLVWLALSQNYLYIVRRSFPNWDDIDQIEMCRSSSDENLDVEGLELKGIIPIDSIKISALDNEYILKIIVKENKSRYFELCTVQGRDKLWNAWLKRVVYLYGDTHDCSSLMLILRRARTATTAHSGGLRLVSASGKESPENAQMTKMDKLSNLQCVCSWTHAVEPVRKYSSSS